MEFLIEQWVEWAEASGWDRAVAVHIVRWTALAGVVLLAVVANWVLKHVILRFLRGLVKRSSFTWDDVLLDTGVFTRLSHIGPVVLLDALGSAVIGPESTEAQRILDNGTTLYLIVVALLLLSASLNALRRIIGRTERGASLPIKGFTQAIMLIACLIAAVFALGTLMGKSPIYFLSGLGALTAVLLLVFKDAILGFVAGIQISVNQMVRVGDWIEMPKAGADGDVIDVSLTTVKVRNWDNTITTIPTYSLISDSFKNWRSMFEGGGRRIKRSLHIDMRTVSFATEAQLEQWRRFRLLKPYLQDKLAEIAGENAALGEDFGVLGNGRRLTNLGTFRAYCLAYLRASSRVRQDMTLLVRHLQPSAQGVPIEIYVFTNDTRWAEYENIQADLFDHLLAVVGQFGLRVFQQPSGSDVAELAERLGGRAEEHL